MQVNVTFRNMDPQEKIRDYAHEKIRKVKKYLREPIEAHVILGAERFRQMAEVNIVAGPLSINGKESTSDIYEAIDLVVDKIERQIKKQKEKMKTNRLLRGADFRIQVISPPEGEGPQVIRSKSYSAKPMSIQEAIEELNLLKNDFIIFTNAETNEVNVLYRRKDGNYGLIEPE